MKERDMKANQILAGTIISTALGVGGYGVVGATEAVPPQFAGNTVTPLIDQTLSRDGKWRVIANLYEVPAGAMVPRHFHHGDEFHLVLSGAWEAEVEGRAPHLMKAGDSQYVESEHWHGGKVVGDAPLKLLGVMIVEKSKPVIELSR
jgi:quercetin dioxygenase-like cupin family protein